MADDYEPNASNIIGVGQATQLGSKLGENVVQGVDMGQQLQQQIMRTQAMHSDLQNKMLDNNAAMVNHLTQRMATLAGMPDESKKGPMWDMQTQALQKDLNSYGAPITPDALDNMLTDPTYSSRLSAALNATANAGLDPRKQAAVVQENAAMLGRPDLITDFPEAVQKSLQAQALLQQKTQGQDIRKQTLVNNFINNTTSLQKDFDKTLEQTSTIGSLLKPGTPYQTGMPQVAAMDALTKALTGTVVRQFTYDNLKGTINAPDALMQYLDKRVNSGQPLNQKQVDDVVKIAKTVNSGADQLRLKMLQAKHNEAKGMIGNAGYAGYEDQIRGAFDPDDWNKLEGMASKNTFNPQTQLYEKSPGQNTSPDDAPVKAKPKAPSVSEYQPGGKQDDFLKSIISSGVPLNEINKRLARKNLKISQDTYNQLKGQ
jgi:hypothetical protein